MKNKINFSPLLFLASLGAGGIAVIPFAFFQYTIDHGKGLIKYADLAHGTLPLTTEILYRSLEFVMIIFALLHIILTIMFIKKLIRFVKSTNYDNFINDPLKNSAILAPFISFTMTMNIFIGPIRYFIPSFADNLQTFMLPALLFWMLLWILILRMEIKLLRISFINNFDVNKITFGWLLHPFALGMLTVVGTGIAALSANSSIAHTAAFMSMITGSMGFFLLIVKLIAIFKSHFFQNGLPEKQFLPSFLIVIPNITLYAISAFRIGHYLEKHMGYHLDSYFFFVIGIAFAFETWYLLFGLGLLKDYFKKDFFKNEYYVTLWGFICPLVAYAVLGSFLYNVFIPSVIIYWQIIIVTAIAVILFFMLLIRYMKCAGMIEKNKNFNCL